MDHLQAEHAVVGGTGMGGTIALRTGLSRPERTRALIVVSLEEIEDDAAKAAETALMDRFAEVVLASGIATAWELYLPDLQPLISTLVREAILGDITAPTLIFPGGDARHPPQTAQLAASVLPSGRVASVGVSAELRTAEDLASAVAPSIRRFLAVLEPASQP